MKRDYRIFEDVLTKRIDEDTRPTRFAIATNALLVTHMDGNKYLVMFNINPEKLNEWYPCFVSHNADQKFTSMTYNELIKEFDQQILANGFSEEKRKEACMAYIEKITQKSFASIRFKKLNQDEYWIKYSQSQGVWTIYLIENYEVETEISLFEGNNIATIPLDEEGKKEWLESGLFKGIKIVDNMYGLLKNGLLQ